MGIGYAVDRRVGIPWYGHDQYERAVALLGQRDSFPLTYDQWKQSAEEAEASFNASGRIPVRVHFEPDQFVAWCTENHMEVGRAALLVWADDAAHMALAGKP